MLQFLNSLPQVTRFVLFGFVFTPQRVLFYFISVFVFHKVLKWNKTKTNFARQPNMILVPWLIPLDLQDSSCFLNPIHQQRLQPWSTFLWTGSMSMIMATAYPSLWLCRNCQYMHGEDRRYKYLWEMNFVKGQSSSPISLGVNKNWLLRSNWSP